MKRRDEVVKMREEGLTYAKIGLRFGISKERVRQIIHGNPKRKEKDPSSKVMLTTGDVARLLGLHPNTVRLWSNQGIIKSFRTGPRDNRRYRRSDIDSFLKGSEIN
jgi:excisionase family DNA binding protein